MRILLSAYACEPDKGSEPWVGWNWAVQLAERGHEVVVITRTNNCQSIEREMAARPRPSLRFSYYDLPSWLRSFKKGRRGIHLYYLLWQFGAYLAARHLVREGRFDVVHHVTFVSVRQPSFMGWLGIPFVFGPVGGGEHTPPLLKTMFSRKNRITEALRELVNSCVRFDPLMWQTFASAQAIYVTSGQSLELIPRRFRGKTRVHLAIGISETDIPASTLPDLPDKERVKKILFCGKLIHWKGPELAVRAFARVASRLPGATLTFVGGGAEQQRLQRLARDFGVSDRIEWRAGVTRSDMLSLYGDFGLFLYPSLHDSGGMVVLEALACGLPVVCLQLGGPGLIVDKSCGIAVDVQSKNVEQVVSDLESALFRLAVSGESRKALAQGAVSRSRRFSWEQLVSDVCSQPPYSSRETTSGRASDRSKLVI
ncbi:MAG: glycosyltransferase family 4 protein [Candidatus Korobacteraceae bacterium]|jgi:glycosyltransferase involved in cell wall biosynthesis